MIHNCNMNFALCIYRIVRLTTPTLNYVIVGGSLLMYLSVFIGLLPAKQECLFMAQCLVGSMASLGIALYMKHASYYIMCFGDNNVLCSYKIILYYLQIYPWVYAIGYFLMYGTIFAKMWRVYQIFHNPKPKQGVRILNIFVPESLCAVYSISFVQFVKTWHMLCIVATITGIGVVLLLTKTILQAFNPPVQVPDAEDPDGRTVCTWCFAHDIVSCTIIIYTSFTGRICSHETQCVAMLFQRVCSINNP